MEKYAVIISFQGFQTSHCGGGRGTNRVSLFTLVLYVATKYFIYPLAWEISNFQLGGEPPGEEPGLAAAGGRAHSHFSCVCSQSSRHRCFVRSGQLRETQKHKYSSVGSKDLVKYRETVASISNCFVSSGVKSKSQFCSGSSILQPGGKNNTGLQPESQGPDFPGSLWSPTLPQHTLHAH